MASRQEFVDLEREIPGNIDIPWAVINARNEIVTDNSAFLKLLDQQPTTSRIQLLREILPDEVVQATLEEVRDKRKPRAIESIWLGMAPDLRVISVSIDILPGSDDLLIVSRDRTAERKTQAGVMAEERSAGLQQLASLAGHELNGALGLIWYGVDESVQGLTESGTGVDLDPALGKGITRIETFLNNLSNIRKPGKAEIAWFDPGEEIREALIAFDWSRESNGIKIDLSCPTGVFSCPGDPRRMREVFIHLIENAYESMPGGGMLTIRAEKSSGPEGERAILTFSDSGEGMDSDELAGAFTPFISTKPGGLGLGLTFCRQVVTKYSGEIVCESRKGAGSRISLTLPLIPEE